MASRLFFFIASLIAGTFLVSQASAGSLPLVRDMYLRPRERARQGSEIRQIERAAAFVWASIDGRSASEREEHLACSMRKTIPDDRGGSFRAQVADLLAGIMRSPGRSVWISMALARRDICSQSMPVAAPRSPLNIVRLDSQGVVVSTNPVWNACVRGGRIPLALIRGNADGVIHRTGHQRTWIPFSCRDYHPGPVDHWKHPDYPDLTIILDDRGRLQSALPTGYLAVRSGQSQSVARSVLAR